MATMEELAIHSQTAYAAYATALVPNESNVNVLRDTASMSQAQAEQFDGTWQVLQQSTPSGDGFSATLFQHRITGEQVLAIAGTSVTSPADLLTDLVNIGILGSIVGMPQYVSLLQFYQQLIGGGLLTSSESFSVSGHSLGGFLAQAFAVIHSSVVTSAYTFNAPGFLGSLGQLGEILGLPGSLPGATITNVRAIDGISLVNGLGIAPEIERGVPSRTLRSGATRQLIPRKSTRNGYRMAA